MKKTRHHFLLVLALVMVPVLCQCARHPSTRVYIQDGKIYGKVRGAFRHRWWNYFERGLSFADGQFYEEAIEDFNVAIKKRNRDQRMARTYGMHFIDYFPHRELGIVYYERGNLEAAKRELELSLSQFITAKAKFYLDRVRKGILEQEERERVSPKLKLHFQKDEVWTCEDPVVISGIAEAEDNNYISGITICISGITKMEVPLFLEGSEKRIDFEKLLALSDGRYVIEVAAKTLLEEETKRQVIIHVDREGPIITIEELHADQAFSVREVKIKGSIYDKAGVSHFSVNDKTVPIQEGQEVSFSKKLTISNDIIKLVAHDTLGNKTSALIDLSGASAGHEPMMLASAKSDLRYLFGKGVFRPKDTRRPTIEMSDWNDIETVYLAKVYLEGQVRDDSKIVSVSVNQVPVPIIRGGPFIFFSKMIHLMEGENTITIEAKNEAGNLERKKLTIIRRIPEALQLEERLSLAVFPFLQKEKFSDISISFQNKLFAALLNRNRFQVSIAEKTDKLLQKDKYIREAFRLGKGMGAQTIMVGRIIESERGIEFEGKMYDTDDPFRPLEVKEVYDEVKDLYALGPLAERMAIEFHREFPLLGGLVKVHKEKCIFTDLGKDKIKLRRRIIIYREEPIKAPNTAATHGTDKRTIGRARIIQVISEEMSKAKLLDVKTDSFTPNVDKVITE